MGPIARNHRKLSHAAKARLAIEPVYTTGMGAEATPSKDLPGPVCTSFQFSGFKEFQISWCEIHLSLLKALCYRLALCRKSEA
jgi:hypothetical protein